MKKSQIVLLIIFLVLTGLMYVALSSNKKTFKKDLKEESKTIYVPVREVLNAQHSLMLTSHGQVTPYSSVIVSSEVQGMLQQGSEVIKPGTSFRKGDILYRINNEESLYSFVSRRSSYANMILNALPDLELDFPSEKEKWFTFMNDLNKVKKRLPELPKINSEKELMFVTARSLISEYYNLKSLESRLDKYLILAPFSGTVSDVFIEPGTIANPGAQIAKIVKTGDFEVKVPISLEDLTFFKEKTTANFTDAAGELIGTGSIRRISDVVNQQTQSADVYYSIKPNADAMIYNGMYLNVNINKEVTKNTTTLPRIAVRDNKVALLDKGKITFKDVLIIGSIPDSVYVTGLENGDNAILEPMTSVEKDVKYEGVKR